MKINYFWLLLKKSEGEVEGERNFRTPTFETDTFKQIHILKKIKQITGFTSSKSNKIFIYVFTERIL